MTAYRIVPGDRGVDYSGARPSPAATVAAGGRLIIRYSAGAANNSSSTQWKLCGTGEIAGAVAAGSDFLANSEWYTSRVTERVVRTDNGKEAMGITGRLLEAMVHLTPNSVTSFEHPDIVSLLARAGTADGIADLAFWRSRGYSRGSSIYCSWDEYPDPRKFPAVAAYLSEHNAALGGYYRSDLYAGTPALKEMMRRSVIRYGWRPNAGSWSNDGIPYQPNTTTAAARASLVAMALTRTPAAILQTGNYWFNKGADEDLILRTPIGSHNESLAPVSPPPVKPPAPKPPAPKPPTTGADMTPTETDNAIAQALYAYSHGDQGKGEWTQKNHPSLIHPAGNGVLDRVWTAENRTVPALETKLADAQTALAAAQAEIDTLKATAATPPPTP